MKSFRQYIAEVKLYDIPPDEPWDWFGDDDLIDLDRDLNTNDSYQVGGSGDVTVHGEVNPDIPPMPEHREGKTRILIRNPDGTYQWRYIDENSPLITGDSEEHDWWLKRLLKAGKQLIRRFIPGLGMIFVIEDFTQPAGGRLNPFDYINPEILNKPGGIPKGWQDMTDPFVG